MLIMDKGIEKCHIDTLSLDGYINADFNVILFATFL